jgi:hypothetical protein
MKAIAALRPRAAIAIGAISICLALTGCGTGGGAPLATSATPTQAGAVGETAQPVQLDPAGPRCDPARAAEFGVVPTKLPEHWPADVPVINGPCFGAFELADSTGGYALEVSVALAGSDVNFDEYGPWKAANSWLADAGMEAVFVDSETAGGRESLYREGLVTTSGGEKFYIVIQYLLNLLNV